MAKPSTLPRWANVSGVLVEPNGAKKDVGWLVDERPPAEFFNWWMKTVYDWTAYLDAGALEDDHSIAGDLDVTGDLTSASIVTGPLEAGDTIVDDLTVGGTLLGDLTIGDDLVVTDDVLIGGDLEYGGSDKYPSQTFNYPYLFGRAQTGVWNRVATGVNCEAGSIWEIPLCVRNGARIRGVTMNYEEGASSTHTLTMRLMKITLGGTVTTVATVTSNPATAAGDANAAISGLTESTTSGAYWVEIEGSDTDTGLILHAIQLTVDKVA